MTELAGMRVTVIGLGRAGTSVTKALHAVGCEVTVVDQKSADSPSLFVPMDALSSLDVPIVTSWLGDIDWERTDAIVPSPGVPANHPTLREAVRRGVPVLSEVEIAWHLAKAPIVGITGTNGKSTVTALTCHILSESGKEAFLCGNIAGSGYDEMPIATAAIKAGKDSILVAEVSSFQLEWVHAFQPRVATITNIVEDHLDRYESFADYASTKLRLYANMGEGDTIVWSRLRPETKPVGARSATLEIGEHAILDAASVVFPDTGARAVMDSLWVPAHHSLVNLAHAVLMCKAMGVETDEGICHAASFRGLKNRLEFVGEKRGVRFVNNSMCTNPEALVASLGALRGRVRLLAGGVSKVRDLKPLESAAAWVEKAYLFGRDAPVLVGPLESGGCACEVLGSMDGAFDRAVAESIPGDTVLLSPGCASFDQFEDFIDRGDHFRKLVKVWMDAG